MNLVMYFLPRCARCRHAEPWSALHDRPVGEQPYGWWRLRDRTGRDLQKGNSGHGGTQGQTPGIWGNNYRFVGVVCWPWWKITTIEFKWWTKGTYVFRRRSVKEAHWSQPVWRETLWQLSSLRTPSWRDENHAPSMTWPYLFCSWYSNYSGRGKAYVTLQISDVKTLLCLKSHQTYPTIVWIFTQGQFWPLGIAVACVCPCVNPEFVCTKTHHLYKLWPPKWDKRCETPC